MSPVTILCVGAGKAASRELEGRLDERPVAYSVTTAPTHHLPAKQVVKADCVVVHSPPVADARVTLEAVRSKSNAVPVVVYAEQGSERLATTAADAGVDRYVRAGENDGWDRLASAVADVTTHPAVPDGGTTGTFHPADIIEQLPTAAFVINEDHEVTYWNEACANLLECDADEILGTTHPYKAFYGESRPVMADLVLDNADDETISQWYDDWYESPYLDGGIVGEDYFPEQDVWLRFTAAPFTDVAGNRGAIETLEEITQRKKHKRELERYETIVETVGDPVYTLDADGYFTFVNDNVVEMTGYSKAEILGEHVSTVVCNEDIEKVRYHIEEMLASDTDAAPVEVDIVTADGDRRNCEIHVATLPYGDQFRGTVGVVRDITERKEREEELRKFKHAVNQAGHAVFLTDADGTIEYVNPAFEEITGYESETALGETPRLLNADEQDPEFYNQLWETILRGDVWEGELINQKKSGERFFAHETIAPIEDQNGGIQGFVGMQDEVTARRLREQQLEVFHRVLRHNLRNKGSAIMGHALLLEQSLTETEDYTHLETIQENVQSLIDVSEKAHHVGQIVADALEKTATRNLFYVLENIGNRVMLSYPEADISLVYEPTQSLDIDARATYAFHELIENAVSHSDAATPRVEMTVTVDGTVATVTIADNGPGIPDQERQVLSAGTEDQLQHSSGLGLWFAQWLIHFVGGNVDIDVDEYGTTVTVTLPVK